MKIVDTFLFCDEYEKELLLAKLTMQSTRVDLHILVESDVTFRGEYKGLQARKMVEEDDRFSPYRASLLTNHWTKSAARGERVGERPTDWFEKVELDEHNSPVYVRDNLDRLRTGLIPVDYRRNRDMVYPDWCQSVAAEHGRSPVGKTTQRDTL